MVLLAVGTAATVAAGLTWLGYEKASSGLRRKSELALGSEALLGASLVDGWLTDRRESLRGLSTLRTVRRVLETAAAPAPDDLDAANLALADVASLSPQIESIDAIDLRGRIVAGTTADEGGPALLQVDIVRKALAGAPAISGVARSPSSGQPCVSVAVPVFGSNGTVVGVLRSRETMERIRGLVEAARARMGAVAQAVLLDADAVVVAGTVDVTRTLAPVPIAELGAAARASRRGVVPFTLGTTRYTAVTEHLPASGWSYSAALPVREIEAEARAFLVRAVVGALLALAAATALSLLAVERALRSVRRLIAVSRKVVEENDLTQPIQRESDDEVGELAESFAQMVGALRVALTTLQDASRSLLEAEQGLRSSIDAQDEMLSHNAASLQQAQVTAQEIRQTSALTASKAQAVLKAAEGADEIGRSGAAALDRTMTGLSEIGAQSADVGARMELLAERARQIGAITETVKDLADQSNMLALNAAIEAVRSGEHGKGFAVVAREIRSLADQSIQATSRVRDILQDLASSIGAAVHMSSLGSRAIDDGLSRMKDSGDGLRGLVAIARGNVDAARQIAAAVGQQDAGVQQLFTAITDQLQLMEQTQKRLARSVEASSSVRAEAERVARLLTRYRI